MRRRKAVPDLKTDRPWLSMMAPAEVVIYREVRNDVEG